MSACFLYSHEDFSICTKITAEKRWANSDRMIAGAAINPVIKIIGFVHVHAQCFFLTKVQTVSQKQKQQLDFFFFLEESTVLLADSDRLVMWNRSDTKRTVLLYGLYIQPIDWSQYSALLLKPGD